MAARLGILRHWQYLKYVLRHKWFVLLAGLSLRVPIWQLILHDWDKFLPDEWFPYARTFYAPDGQKQYVESDAFTLAWNAHQKRNKHHWQYWMITWDRGETECLPMSDKHRREMLADWMGAGRALGKPDTALWYTQNDHKIRLHPDTRAWIEEQLLNFTEEELKYAEFHVYSHNMPCSVLEFALEVRRREELEV